MLNLSELLPAVVAISEKAGEAILTIYNQPERWQVQNKSDNSPLTAADMASHHIIDTALRQLLPMVPVLSEESNGDMGERHTWQSLWLVDPLDGTKEFIKRTNDFTVNIALVVDNKPILGVLHAPVYGVTYAAFLGGGAWVFNQQGEKTAISTSEAASIPRVLLSRNHKGGKEGAVLEKVTARFGDYVALEVGSAFKMCRVAEGAADFYPRLGPTMEWDTAAAQILVEEAGGVLVDIQGIPLTYNARDTLTNGEFFVIGEKALTQDWLACCITN
ncbi:3'(2'),5'-bisphosphate nucleotidase CysQ [Agitococcus lubricus]|uniref:3'(2'),5'-bisphosphate nucleotidase CysQ n=1 Tax=Agitococcus lubricus TaxID=1077255 RepID=A0A2T5J006_9GAMM|nr:3'(2'),5'-bisphosphate nucleotidase CysQ [Agitococcus lubricus]PTQ89679.1 3'(2'),5'-bisphosphate nucleotidase [Agitococcus lubricus]